MQKNVSHPYRQPLTPTQQQFLNFILDIDPEDLHEVSTAALYLLADSEMVEGKRWILVRLTEYFHKISKEKS